MVEGNYTVPGRRPIPRESYDVVVVGAGPAGCAAASLLAHSGYSVLLIDRARFPRDKLCTHAIMPAGLPVLERMGVLSAVEAAGAQRWYGVKLWLNGVGFAEPLPRRRVAYTYGFSLRRSLLDEILLDSVRRSSGVEVRTDAEATSLMWDRGGVAGVMLSRAADQFDSSCATPPHSAGSGGVAVRSRFVVLAGGRHTRLARSAGLRTMSLPNRHTAYIAYVDGVPREARPALEGYYWHGRSASLLPADGGLRVAGFMAPPGSWPAGGWGDRLLYELRRFPPLRDRLHDARLVTRPISVSGLRNVWRGSAARGLLLIGDVGVQTDPLFGQGISWALRTGAWAASAIDRSLRDEDDGRPRFASLRTRTLGPRFLAMSTVSAIPQRSLLERLLIANAAANPASTRLFLRLILGFGTLSRDTGARRSLRTWVHEALTG